MTPPARRSFSICARHKGLAGSVGCVLPVKARVRHVILGVSAPVAAKLSGTETTIGNPNHIIDLKAIVTILTITIQSGLQFLH